MLGHGKAFAENNGLMNTKWIPCNFKTADIDELGLREAFDLVFWSITPAVSELSTLKKAIAMSRGYCFSSYFLSQTDSVEEDMRNSCFPESRKEPAWEGRWFYSLFNIVYLLGYYPVTAYHEMASQDLDVIDDELIRYFTRQFSKDGDEKDNAVREKVAAYLTAHQTDEGKILRKTKSMYGWTLWDVRKKGDHRM